MYCSACGQALKPEQGFCPKCGRPSAASLPSVPGMAFQLENYAGKVRTLAIVWFIYAGLSVLLGVAGLTFAHAFFSHLGMWGHGPWGDGSTPPEWLGPTIFHIVWIALLGRAVLALVTGWGLLEHTQWGRIVAIVAAILSLIKFPFGTALGVWTLIVLLGYRNSTLYEQL